MDDLVQSAIAPVVARLSAAIAKQVSLLAAQQLEAELATIRARRGRVPGASRAKPRKIEMTKWVADNRARRVPKFVIEATGLDTKKKIVGKYGAGAAFTKGKPLPPVAETTSTDSKPEVKAKLPIIRKKGKAA